MPRPPQSCSLLAKSTIEVALEMLPLPRLLGRCHADFRPETSLRQRNLYQRQNQGGCRNLRSKTVLREIPGMHREGLLR